MNEKFRRVVKQVSSAADKAAKGAGRLARKGKETLDHKALKKELEKAQRQLGALTYEALRAGCWPDETAAAKYVSEIDRLAADLERLRPDEDAKTVCRKCGARVREDAMFCSGCGAKLG